MFEWNKNRSKFICSLSCIVLLYTVGCKQDPHDYNAREEQTSTLALELQSYSSVGEVTDRLDQIGATFSVVEDSESPGSLTVPRFDVLVLQTEKSQLGSYSGFYQLTLFNDRLMEVRFYPTDHIDPSAILEGLRPESPLSIKPHTDISIHQDYKDRVYISWTDLRLQKQYAYWINNYT